MMPQQPGGQNEWPNTENGVVPADDKAKAVFTAQVDVVSAEVKAGQERETETHKDALAQASTRLTEQAAEQKAESDNFRAAAVAERAADLDNLSKFFDSMSALAVGAVERGRAGAEVVQKASAAIVTLYTGILALVFAAGNNPLPTRGVLAPIFLGLAVVLSTAYLGYVTPSKDIVSGPAVVAGVESKTYARLNTTTAISSTIATRRSYLLRAGVLALGVGLVFIVLPFVSLGTATPASAAASVSPAWPTPSSGLPDALNAIVYKAQVDEVAAARKSAADAAAAPTVDDTGALVLIGILGLAVTFGVPAVWKNG